MCALFQGPDSPLLYVQEHGLQWAPNVHQDKLVYLQPRLCLFSLKIVQSKWWVIVWSSMKSENTQANVQFIFIGIEPPCMVLGQELWTTLLTMGGRVVGKPGNSAVNQYLKVLKPIFQGQCPTMIGCPYDLRPTRDNTLTVDNSPSRNILNPPPTT